MQRFAYNYLGLGGRGKNRKEEDKVYSIVEVATSRKGFTIVLL